MVSLVTDRTTKVNARTRRLCMALRRLRMEQGMTKTKAAQLIGVSPSTISRAETGERGINRDDLAALLAVYRTKRSLRNALLKLHREAQNPDMLVRGDLHVHDDLQKWIGFEQDASRIRNYEPLLIPGLLQTFPYARAVIAGGVRPKTEQEVADRTAARIARQALLRHPRTPMFDVILHEAALRQRVGDVKIMGQQLAYLLEAAAREGTTIRVIPGNVGVHAGMDGPFVIMDYEDLPSLVHLENKVSSLYLEDAADVESYKLAYDNLLVVAHSPERSLELIGKIVSGVA